MGLAEGLGPRVGGGLGLGQVGVARVDAGEFVEDVLLEALEAGASAILLIVRALSDDELKILREAADVSGLDCLYEIHEEEELTKSLRHDPKILGVNNRDLTRFVTVLEISEKLIPQIPDGIIKVSESGIFEPEDAWQVRECGADAVLCGEALMRSDDVEGLIHQMKQRD